MHRTYSPFVVCVVAGITLGACSDSGVSTAPPRTPASPPALSVDSHYDAPVFTSIDISGAAGTFALDITAHGVVVGRFSKAGKTHGFLRSATGELSIIDYPGADFTVASAINRDGDIVGMYAWPGALNRRHGFILRDGVFTTFDPPGSNWTNVLGINDHGLIAGRYCTLDVCRKTGLGDFHGFKMEDGEITTIDVPGAKETNGWKSNTRGEIVGSFVDAAGTGHLFLRRDEDLTTFDLPGALPITQENGGINAAGDIVGLYCEFSPCEIGPVKTHGFVLRNGDLATIDYPGAAATGVFAINARGDLAGGYYDSSGHNHGFLLQR